MERGQKVTDLEQVKVVVKVAEPERALGVKQVGRKASVNNGSKS